MKRCIIVTALVIGFASLAGAATNPLAIKFSNGSSIDVPFQKVSLTNLYAFNSGKGYVAPETVILDWKNPKGIPVSTTAGKFNLTEIQLTVGDAPVIGSSKNVMFAGIQTRLPTPAFDISNNSLLFGVWAGKSLTDRQWLYGVKASIPLF